MNNPRWRSTRDRVIERDGGRCRFCGCKDSLQVHHIRYCNDRGETDYFDMKNLITLCAPCHQIITEAVKKAKTINVPVPVFLVKPGVNMTQQIESKIKHAAYAAESDLVADTLFEIWKRSLRSDCDGINMRNLKVMRPIGETVMLSIEWQAGVTVAGYGVAFAERTINRITQHLAEAYNHYARDGMTDQEFMFKYRMTSTQMSKIKRNAERLHRTGDYRSTGSDTSG